MPRGFYARLVKRPLDLVAGSLILFLLSPVMILVALAVKLTSRGPVLYTQERVGWRGRPFRLVKFRSMVTGAEGMGAGMLVERNDNRITAVGRLIRKLSLDELPQIFNILRGQMSLVGPRPGLAYQAEQYDDHQRKRLLVRPGITGWAQVNGRNSINWERRIQLDVEYVERLSLWLDLVILLRTLPAVLGGGDMIADADYWKEKARRRAASGEDRA